MIDKNPYEKDDVDVPNFGDSQDKGNDPIFNMDTTSISPETDSFSIEEEAESSSKTAIIVMVVFMVLFLIGAISGWLFGINKSGEATRAKEELDQYKITAQKQITDLETQLSTITLERDTLKAQQTVSNENTGTGDNTGTNATGPGTKTEANTYYLMDEGVGVRSGAGTSNAYVDYNKLPQDIQNLVYYDKEGKKVTTRPKKFPVYEIKQAGNQNWGRIADNAWVCIDYGKKQ